MFTKIKLLSQDLDIYHSAANLQLSPSSLGEVLLLISNTLSLELSQRQRAGLATGIWSLIKDNPKLIQQAIGSDHLDKNPPLTQEEKDVFSKAIAEAQHEMQRYELRNAEKDAEPKPHKATIGASFSEQDPGAHAVKVLEGSASIAERRKFWESELSATCSGEGPGAHRRISVSTDNSGTIIGTGFGAFGAAEDFRIGGPATISPLSREKQQAEQEKLSAVKDVNGVSVDMLENALGIFAEGMTTGNTDVRSLLYCVLRDVVKADKQ